MASTVDISKVRLRMMPYVAILQHDLRTLWRSRLLRLWLFAAIVLAVFLTMSNWAKLRDAPLIASLLFPFLVFPWFLVIIILGVTPVSGTQAETLADGILSRPVTRYGYLVTTWAARVVAVLGVYFAVMIPLIAIVTLAKRPGVTEDSVTIYGVVTTLFVVALVLTFIVSLGFLAGTLLRKPLLAAIVLIFAWYPVNLVLSVFSLEELSPISLNQAATTQLRRHWREDPEEAKARANKAEGEALGRLFTNALGSFSGNTQQTTEPEQTTDPDFFEPDKFDDFSLLRVTVGYGMPTLAAVGLAILCFCRRDM